MILLCLYPAQADLVYPASYDVVEEAPGEVSVTLTLPLIQGRVMKARPILPEAIRIEGDPEARAGAGSVTRVWRGSVDTGALSGSVFGLTGLLGTSSEVRFSLSTLGGRRYEEVLRPIRAFFVVPEPPTWAALAGTSVREGLRRAARHAGLWFLLAALAVAGVGACASAPTFAVFALGLYGGYLVDARRPGPGIPLVVSTLAGLAVFAWAVSRWPGKAGLGRRNLLFVVLTSLLTGVLVGWAGGLSVTTAGLSLQEAQVARVLSLAGWLLGAGMVSGVVVLGWSLLPERGRAWAVRFLGLFAATWFLYQGAGLVRVYGPGWLIGGERAWLRLAHGWLAPFAADWAMAKLRVPWFSLLAIAIGIVLVSRMPSRRKRLMAAGGALCLAACVLPWGTSRLPLPFMSARPPEGGQAMRILEPMLSGIYHAVNLEEEGQAYDRLAEHVTGDMLSDLYIDSRRRMLAGTREGAKVTVKAVDLVEVGPLRGTEGARVYPCRWTVTARVTHWSHTHERLNLYEGDLALVVDGDRWKIGSVNLRLEERQVVSGSFSG